MKRKNNPYTPSYFIKRLKDSGYNVWRMFDDYGDHDSRYWTLLVDPGGSSVWITCYLNKEERKDYWFELDDGGINAPRKLLLKTESVETVINRMISFGIEPQSNSEANRVKVPEHITSK